METITRRSNVGRISGIGLVLALLVGTLVTSFAFNNGEADAAPPQTCTNKVVGSNGQRGNGVGGNPCTGYGVSYGIANLSTSGRSRFMGAYQSNSTNLAAFFGTPEFWVYGSCIQDRGSHPNTTSNGVQQSLASYANSLDSEIPGLAAARYLLNDTITSGRSGTTSWTMPGPGTSTFTYNLDEWWAGMWVYSHWVAQDEQSGGGPATVPSIVGATNNGRINGAANALLAVGRAYPGPWTVNTQLQFNDQDSGNIRTVVRAANGAPVPGRPSPTHSGVSSPLFQRNEYPTGMRINGVNGSNSSTSFVNGANYQGPSTASPAVSNTPFTFPNGAAPNGSYSVTATQFEPGGVNDFQIYQAAGQFITLFQFRITKDSDTQRAPNPQPELSRTDAYETDTGVSGSKTVYPGDEVRDRISYNFPAGTYNVSNVWVNRTNGNPISGMSTSGSFTVTAAQAGTDRTYTLPAVRVPSDSGSLAGVSQIVATDRITGTLASGGSIDPIEHNSLSDSLQTVNLSRGTIRTEASEGTGLNDQNVIPGNQIFDTAFYTNLAAGNYRSNVTWYQLNTNGTRGAQRATASADFSVGTDGASGSVRVGPTTTPVTASGTWVAYHTITRLNGVNQVVVAEQDPSETQQRIIFTPPTIRTEASEGAGLDDQTVIPGSQIFDTAFYTNLPGGGYTSTVTWYQVNTNGTATTSDDTRGTSRGVDSRTFTVPAGGGSGSVRVGPFTTPQNAQGTWVAYHTISGGGLTISEQDLTEAEQRITFPAPSITTTARDTDDSDRTVFPGDQLNDVVAYTDFAPGNYTATVRWMDKATGNAISGATASRTFTVAQGAPNGTVTVGPVNVPTGYTGDLDWVAFEVVARTSTPGVNARYAVEENINEVTQTATLVEPDIDTIAFDNNTQTDKIAEWGSDIRDRVDTDDLDQGSYTATTTWYNRATGSPVAGLATGTATITVTSDSQARTVITTPVIVPSGTPAGTWVAFTRVVRNDGPAAGQLVVAHENLNDIDQSLTIVVPEIGTLAFDNDFVGTGGFTTTDGVTTATTSGAQDQVGEWDGDIYDRIGYSNFDDGSYIATVQWVDGTTGEPIEGATSSQSFTVSTDGNGPGAGIIEVGPVRIPVGTTSDTWVAFESVVKVGLDTDGEPGDDIYAVHEDLDDADQTINIVQPEIATIGYDNGFGDSDYAFESEGDGPVTVTGTSAPDQTGEWNGSIFDRIGYNNFNDGDYIATVQWVDGATGEPIEGATASTEFSISTDGRGPVDGNIVVGPVRIPVGTTSDTWVAFETVERVSFIVDGDGATETLVYATHEDVSDINQTINIVQPEIGTLAYDGEFAPSDYVFTTAPDGITTADGDIAPDQTGEWDGDVYDRIGYSNFNPGTYRATVTWVDGTTGEPIEGLDHPDNVFTADFTVEDDGNGPVDGNIVVGPVRIPVGTTSDTWVAYETVELVTVTDGEDQELTVYAVHEDLDDANQTIDIVQPEIGTLAYDDERDGGYVFTTAPGTPASNGVTTAGPNEDPDAEESAPLDQTGEWGGDVYDRIGYSNFNPGTYRATVTWVDGTTGEPIEGLDHPDNVFTADFTVEDDGNGPVDGNIVVGPVRIPVGTTSDTWVAYETVEKIVFIEGEDGTIEESAVYAVHEDLSDANQTIDIVQPEIATTASDAVDGDQEVLAGDDVLDTITYTNFDEGTYRATVQWYDQATGDAIDGATASQNFVVEADGDGVVVVGLDDHEIDGDADTVTVPIGTSGNWVAYETVIRIDQDEPVADGEDQPVYAEHKDIDDEAQTVTILVPSIETQAFDPVDGDNIIGAEGGISDTVLYTNFNDGQYTATVQWVDKATGEPIEGKTTTADFTVITDLNDEDNDGLDGTSGEVIVGPLDFGDVEPGSTFVAFERVDRNGDVIAETDPDTEPEIVIEEEPFIDYAVHEDIDDEAQTGYKPEITTEVRFATASGPDPIFDTCREANENGYGNYRNGIDAEYSEYTDADNDGIACEFENDEGNNMLSMRSNYAQDGDGVTDIALITNLPADAEAMVTLRWFVIDGRDIENTPGFIDQDDYMGTAEWAGLDCRDIDEAVHTVTYSVVGSGTFESPEWVIADGTLGDGDRLVAFETLTTTIDGVVQEVANDDCGVRAETFQTPVITTRATGPNGTSDVAPGDKLFDTAFVSHLVPGDEATVRLDWYFAEQNAPSICTADTLYGSLTYDIIADENGGGEFMSPDDERTVVASMTAQDEVRYIAVETLIIDGREVATEECGNIQEMLTVRRATNGGGGGGVATPSGGGGGGVASGGGGGGVATTGGALTLGLIGLLLAAAGATLAIRRRRNTIAA